MKLVTVILSLLLLGVVHAQQPVEFAQTALVAANLTNTTCTGPGTGTGCLAVTTVGYGIASFSAHGTYAGATVTFEFSDDGGTTWYQNGCTSASAAKQVNSVTLADNSSITYDCGIYGTTNVRMRVTAIGSGTLVAGVTLSSASIEPAPTVAAIETDSTGSGRTFDPCMVNAKSYANINQTANAKIITGTSGKKIYVCSFHLVTATAQNVAVVEGTGTACATTTVAVDGLGGGGTAATGWNFGANGGIAYGSGGNSIGAMHTATDDLCVYQSSTGQVSGGLSYVVQ